MCFKSWKLGSWVLFGELCVVVACLTLLSPMWVHEARGTLPASLMGPPPPDCRKSSYTVRKYGRRGVITKRHTNSLFHELGEPDLPIRPQRGLFSVEDFQYQYCWRCNTGCPQGQQQDTDYACIYMDSDWRVTHYGIPGCKRTLTEAESIREKAEQGDKKAQTKLGNMYGEGKGVLKDYSEAVKWYRKAAEQGNARAQYNLGLSYQRGTGVNKSNEEAKKWFTKAAEQGHENSKKKLAEISPGSDL